VDDERMVARQIGRAEIIVCAAPGYLKRHGRPRSPEDLGSHNVYLYSHRHAGASREWVFEREGRTVRANVRGNLSFSNGEALVEAALAGEGIVGVFDFIASQALRSRKLVRVLGDWRTPAGPAISVVYPPHRHLLPKVRSFAEYTAAVVSSALGSDRPALIPGGASPPRSASRRSR
jgi:LysR family transcriptional regulator for bpeEF and oprC